MYINGSSLQSPSDFAHFRNRIGIKGKEKILGVSIRLHGKSLKENDDDVVTAIQEKT